MGIIYSVVFTFLSFLFFSLCTYDNIGGWDAAWDDKGAFPSKWQHSLFFFACISCTDFAVRAASMTTWADDDDVRDYDKRRANEEADDDEQEKAIWDSIKPTTIYDLGDNGERIEIVKKIRIFSVRRPTTAGDLRAKLVPFGKAKAHEFKEGVLQKEPPLPLELGSADKYERESRTELKRLLAEHLDELRLSGKDSLAQGGQEGGEQGDGAETSTWGNNRSITLSKPRGATHPTSEVRRRVRVCNVSDDINEAALRAIFSANGAEVDRVFLAIDKETGNNRGYAFITFRDEKWVDLAVRQRRFNFRNVVLSVSYAKDRNA